MFFALQGLQYCITGAIKIAKKRLNAELKGLQYCRAWLKNTLHPSG